MAKKDVPAVQKPGALVSWQEQLAKQAAEAASKEVASSEFVSFRGGVLQFNGQTVPGNSLDVIVLDTAYEHAFYGDMVDGKPVGWPFDPDNPKSPNCYAFGRVESELAPLKEGENAPALVVSDSCATCPLNEWKSDPDGGKGKACKNVRRVALISAGVLASGNPEAVKAATVVFAKPPVTSGKFLSEFIIQVAQVCKRPPHGVIAKLKVEADPRNQFVVKWEYVDNIPDEFMPAIMEKREKLGDAILFTYPSNDEREQAPAQPAKTAGKYTPGQTPPKPQKGVKGK